MGFRFRKSKSVGPFRLNMSKSGIGWSVGVPGLRYSQKAGGGSRVTASIPGTGISYVTDSKKPTRKHQERIDEPDQKLLDYAATPAKEQPGRSVGSGSSGNGSGKRPGHGCLWWIVAVLFWPISLSVWFWRSNAIASKKLKAGILAAVWVLLLVSSGNDSSTTTALPTSSSAAPSSVVVSFFTSQRLFCCIQQSARKHPSIFRGNGSHSILSKQPGGVKSHRKSIVQ